MVDRVIRVDGGGRTIVTPGTDLLAPFARAAQDALDRINEFTTGPAGPAANGRINLAALKAAATTDRYSLYDGSLWTWTTGDFTGQTDDINIVKADATSLATGAWLRDQPKAFLWTDFTSISIPSAITSVTSVGYSVAGKGVARYVIDPDQTTPAASRIRQKSFNNRWFVVDEPEVYATQVGVMLDTVTNDSGPVSGTDDTAALQALLDIAKPVIIEPGKAKITGALTRTQGQPIYMMPGAEIVPTGSAYTALSITNTPGTSSTLSGPWRLSLASRVAAISSRPTINALLWDNPAAQDIEAIAVQGFDGFGLKLLAAWDCAIHTITVSRCGNATNYAFEMNAGANGHCNEGMLSRLQVEESQEKAIYIAAGTLNTSYGTIHSERAYSSSNLGLGNEMWVLSGNCKYRNVRLTKEANAPHASPVVPRAYVGGESLEISLRAEDSIPVRADSTLNTVFRASNLSGPLSTSSGNSGRVTFSDSYAAEIVGNTSGLRIINSQVDLLAPTSSFFVQDSTITGYTDNASARGTWRNVEIVNAVAMIGGFHDFDGHFIGNLIQSSGSMSCIFSDRTYGSGTVASTFLAAPSGGIWSAGQRTYRIIPATGQPKSWVLQGGVGWTSEGNL